MSLFKGLFSKKESNCCDIQFVEINEECCVKTEECCENQEEEQVNCC